MIVQLHHQDVKNLDETEMVAQSDDFDPDDPEVGRKYRDWITGAQERHPCPEGKQFLLCREGASMFVYAAPKDVDERSRRDKPGETGICPRGGM